MPYLDPARHREVARRSEAKYRLASPHEYGIGERAMLLVEKGPRCWLWTGKRNRQDYGVWRGRLAHRLVYEFLIGPIPDGLTIDHLCRVPACVNPAHLEPVTMGENTLRGYAPNIVIHRRGTCPQGHSDWRMKSNGTRRCRECERQREKSRIRDRRRIPDPEGIEGTAIVPCTERTAP